MEKHGHLIICRHEGIMVCRNTPNSKYNIPHLPFSARYKLLQCLCIYGLPLAKCL